MLEWAAEFSIEPWGDIRVDRGAALVGAMVGNGAGGKKGGGRFSVAELMPRWDGPKEGAANSRPKWQEDLDKLKAYTILRGGVVCGESMSDPKKRTEQIREMVRKGVL